IDLDAVETRRRHPWVAEARGARLAAQAVARNEEALQPLLGDGIRAILAALRRRCAALGGRRRETRGERKAQNDEKHHHQRQREADSILKSTHNEVSSTARSRDDFGRARRFPSSISPPRGPACLTDSSPSARWTLRRGYRELPEG